LFAVARGGVVAVRHVPPASESEVDMVGSAAVRYCTQCVF
jgi:hypothetical protein